MNKTIIARLKGGLGNQLFIYAASLQLAEKYGCNLKLDKHSGFWNDKYKRSYELDLIGINKPVLNLIQSVFIKIIGKFHILQSFFGCKILTEKNCDSYVPEAIKYRFIILDDYFQCEKYFEAIAEKLISEINFKIPQDTQIKNLLTKINDTNAVCVHGRLLRAYAADGSKVSVSDPRIVDRDYFLDAVKRFREQLSEPHFFIFSDDPPGMSELLALKPEECTLILHDYHRNSEVDFGLMMKCKHFIIPNSTYSWWAAKLAQSNEKYISVPDEGFWDNPCLTKIGNIR